MQASERKRAVTAALAVASEAGLDAAEAVVLQDSNKLTLRLRPGDVLARVGPAAEHDAAFEIGLAQRLAAAGSPVATLDARVEPRIRERDGFTVTLWTYYETVGETSAPAYAEALARLHAGMRTVDLTVPHVGDRIGDARARLADRDRTPALPDADRDVLAAALRTPIGGGREQLLHGEPHPGNLLATAGGPVFIDLETCCRGPVEFDLAHAPAEVAAHYPGADRELLRACRIVVLAMIVTWRWDRDDQLPDGEELAAGWFREMRALTGA